MLRPQRRIRNARPARTPESISPPPQRKLESVPSRRREAADKPGDPQDRAIYKALGLLES